ncbi:MAG: corrinoid protein [Chloroflexota bacterium]|nr:MAG: corrinoid protein [Chloroflexota bacterium]
MEKEQILENLAVAIVEGDEDKAVENAKAAMEAKLDPLETVENGLSKGMDDIGEKFGKGEVFLPELLMAANAFKSAMEILKPELEAQKMQTAQKGTILIGTVKGDVHNIGKDIVSTVLETKGFNVVDIGVDNDTLSIIQEAEKAQADVIALSCLMTTTMPAQREFIEVLEEMNLREKYFVIVGGGPVTQEWADEIKADGYGESAVEAPVLVKELIRKK